MMRVRMFVWMIAAPVFAALIGGSSFAAEKATKDEAVAMVKRAVVFIKEKGLEKAYAEISNREGQFIDRDLYVVVYRLDGKFFVKERIELANQQPTFWQDYKFMNPVSHKVEPKEMYCERLEDTAVCGGVYKS